MKLDINNLVIDNDKLFKDVDTMKLDINKRQPPFHPKNPPLIDYKK